MTVGFRIRRKTDHQWWRDVDRRNPLNTDSPLLVGCRLLWLPLPWLTGTINLFSLLGPNGTLTNMVPTTDWMATSLGPALSCDGVNDDVRTAVAPALSLPLTFAVCRVSGTVTAAQAAAGAASIYVDLSATATTGTFTVRNSGGTSGSTNWAVASASVSDQSGLFVGVSSSSTSHMMYAPDGTIATSNVSSGVSASALRFAMGSVPRSSPLYRAGVSSFAGRWDRATSESEVAELQRMALAGWTSGPHAILRTQSTRRYSFGAPNGGSPPAATLFRRSLQSRIGSRGAA